MGLNMSNETQELTLDYGWEEVFNAVEKTALDIRGMKVGFSNKVSKTISLKASVSIRSYGENISVSLNPIADGKTVMTITSVTKVGGYSADLGKNRKNIDAIINGMTKYLSQGVTRSSENPSRSDLGEEQPAGVIYCRQCGKASIESGSKFCNACGAELNKEFAPSSDKRSEKKELKQERKTEKKELKRDYKTEKKELKQEHKANKKELKK